MKTKGIIISLLILPAIIMGISILRQRNQQIRFFAGEEKILDDWKQADFTSITNKDALSNLTATLVHRFNAINLLSQPQENALKLEVIQTFRAFSSSKFVDYWEFRCPPTYQGDIAWNKQALADYKEMLPSPSVVAKEVTAGRMSDIEDINEYSLSTNSNLFKYAWILLNQGRTKSQARAYTTDTWTGVAFRDCEVLIGKDIPTPEAEARRETHVGLYWLTPCFVPAVSEISKKESLRCNIKIMIKTIDFTEAYPVYIQYVYINSDSCWVPVQLAAGCNGKGIDYIF